jgi:2-polyprenyl-3-methyl-5-hydroxy-6-metoxy-1,4-benzoquinol methylase
MTAAIRASFKVEDGDSERPSVASRIASAAVHHRRAAFRAWRSYRGQPLRLRAFLAGRLLVLPLSELAREFERLDGHVLGVGSGHGLIARYLAEVNPGVTVTGIDVDAERVAVARATEARSARVRIRRQDVRALDAHAEFDAAAAVDLMHHVPQADHKAVAEALARAVKPGGQLLIKDIAPMPPWKHQVNRLHDRVVSGEATTTTDPASLAELFERAGFSVERLERIAPLSPYPHFILRARRGRAKP